MNKFDAQMGKDLEFISRIKRDGSGTEMMEDRFPKHLNTTVFQLQCLSITQGTWIASEFNSYVVKLKNQS